MLAVATLDAAVATFRRCGVVAIEGAVPLGTVKRVRRSLASQLRPYLSCRARLRKRLLQGVHGPMQQAVATSSLPPGVSPQQEHAARVQAVWEDTLSRDVGGEAAACLTRGDTFRERNDGRIDIALPFAPPFNDTELTFSPFVYPVLAELLGLDVRLKRLNAVVALDASDGVTDQHWHRDAGLLFEPDGVAHEAQVHDRVHGVHLPPAGINMFVPLVDMTPENGPTEFTLASHQWGPDWGAEEAGAVDWRFMVPRGTAILADYRTVHRGTSNRSGRRRPLAMLIYGREWWSDAVNYGTVNVGGARNVERRYGSLASLVSELASDAAARGGGTAGAVPTAGANEAAQPSNGGTARHGRGPVTGDRAGGGGHHPADTRDGGRDRSDGGASVSAHAQGSGKEPTPAQGDGVGSLSDSEVQGASLMFAHLARVWHGSLSREAAVAMAGRSEVGA